MSKKTGRKRNISSDNRYIDPIGQKTEFLMLIKKELTSLDEWRNYFSINYEQLMFGLPKDGTPFPCLVGVWYFRKQLIKYGISDSTVVDSVFKNKHARIRKDSPWIIAKFFEHPIPTITQKEMAAYRINGEEIWRYIRGIINTINSIDEEMRDRQKIPRRGRTPGQKLTANSLSQRKSLVQRVQEYSKDRGGDFSSDQAIYIATLLETVNQILVREITEAYNSLIYQGMDDGHRLESASNQILDLYFGQNGIENTEAAKNYQMGLEWDAILSRARLNELKKLTGKALDLDS